ncbi:MAG TPA: DNA repair protein RadA, partial [Capillimicrobium sp.]
MARPTTIHVCSACGHTETRWQGKCPGCGAWNTLVEERAPTAPAGGRGGAARGGSARARAAKPVALRDVQTPRLARLSTGIGEFDRVLGGGLVPGSLVLLGGSP